MSDTNNFAQDSYIATAGQAAFTITFSFLDTSHLIVLRDGIESVAFSVSGTTLTLNSAAALGEHIVIIRRSPDTFNNLLFQATNVSTLDQSDLDTLVKSLLYQTQELTDRHGQYRTVTLTGNSNVDINENSVVLVDTTAGNVSLNLPNLANSRGRYVTILKKEEANSVLIGTRDSATINGEASDALADQYDFNTYYRGPDEWYKISSMSSTAGTGGSYVHPNHAGDVTSVGDGLTYIAVPNQTGEPAGVAGRLWYDPSGDQSVYTGTINNHSDVDAASATSGDYLQYNGTSWVNVSNVDLEYTWTLQTGAYTILESDTIVYTSGNSVTLPHATGNDQKVFHIKNLSPTTATTVTGGGLIDDQLTQDIQSYNNMTIHSDNTSWWII